MPFNTKEYDRWLRQAEQTMASAQRDLKAGDHNWSCFKAQQSAEYSLKGLLHGLGFSPMGHSLVKLLGDLDKRGVDISRALVMARTLDRHYIPSRYANAHVEGSPYEYYDRSTARAAISASQSIIRFVRRTAKKFES